MAFQDEFNPKHRKLFVLETDGSLSVIGKNQNRKETAALRGLDGFPADD